MNCSMYTSTLFHVTVGMIRRHFGGLDDDSWSNVAASCLFGAAGRFVTLEDTVRLDPLTIACTRSFIKRGGEKGEEGGENNNSCGNVAASGLSAGRFTTSEDTVRLDLATIVCTRLLIK